MCIKLEEETGVTSWTENGGLFIACNKERLAEYERLYTLGQYYGVESRMLSPKEALDIYPILNVDDVYGAMHSPTDGTIDPAGVVTQYKKAATRLGSRFVEGCAISSIETENYSVFGRERRRVLAVNAGGQRIKTKLVINCTGAWSNEVANMVGINIPLRAMKHAMVITETMEGVHPGLPNLRDHDLSIYFKTQGNSLALGGYEQNPEFWKDVDPEFSFGLFELDWDTFCQNMNGHIQRCPLVESTGIQSTVCGPEAFTPDHKPLVGPDVDLEGFVHCSGFNSMGMMLGGGVGREVAAWVTEGAPTVDLFSMDVARFHPSTVGNSRWVEDRTHESYAKTYSIVFPHDEPLAGRQMRKSALYDVLLARGCVYQSRQGFERPGWFNPAFSEGSSECKEYDFYGAYADQGDKITGLDRDSLTKHEDHTYHKMVDDECTFDWGASLPLVAEECAAIRNGVALFDQSYFGKFFLEGPDASQAADWLCTAKMGKDRAIGSVAYTALCNERGGVMCDLTFTKLSEDKFYIAAGGSTSTHDWRWISSRLAESGYKAALRDATDDYSMISVQGPYSRQLLKDIVDVPLDDEHMPFSTCRHVRIAGHELMALRLTFVGELGFELHVPSQSAVAVYEAIMVVADRLSASGVKIANSGYRAIDSCSAEKGYRHWHADLTNKDTPFEAGIGFVALAKLKTDTPFLGREALEKQRAEGLKRKLVCLTLDEVRPASPLHGRETIWRNDECVGFIKSTAFGFSIGKQIAYGYVDAPDGKPLKPKDFNTWLKEGTFKIGDRVNFRSATFQIKAPFDPSNLRIKGEYESIENDAALPASSHHALDPLMMIPPVESSMERVMA
jgi:sarcosine dehydrogenase